MTRKPNVVLFEKEVAAGKVTRAKRDEFRRYLAKLAADSPEREDAAAVWAEYERRGAPIFEPMQNAPSRTPNRGADRRSGDRNQTRFVGRGSSPRNDAGRERPAHQESPPAPASHLGQPFHNPYTFIPFDPEPPTRRRPTPLTADEIERDRMTGVIELTLEAVSPLLTSAPTPKSRSASGHPSFDALRVGRDVVVPATGIRGALRSLLSILTSGTLGYVDDELWLTQGRDAKLGPRSQKAPDPMVPVNCFLAEVLSPGGRGRPGTVRVGAAELWHANTLGDEADRRRPRQGDKRPGVFRIDDSNMVRWEERPGAGEDLLRLSGRPIRPKGKREGILRRDASRVIELPEHLWVEYEGRHRHADFPELHKGYVVWLEPASPDLREIRGPEDVRSIQWARWGRHGDRLLDLLQRYHPHVVPDSLRSDGLVDEVTDLFGQIPSEAGAAGPFAARVRPENLVFENAKTTRATLSPLVAPHPGCRAFYRRPDPGQPGQLLEELRGYKVYRNTAERDPSAPWHYATQGIFHDDGSSLKTGTEQKVNRTVELLDPGQRGRVRIAYRALSRRELALVLAACTVDWRLGGGKPLGLGHCRVVDARLVDEDGMTFFHGATAGFSLPEDLRGSLDERFRRRLEMWRAAQTPVPRLRYPRAVNENGHRKQRGGHVWFQRHASPKKSGEGAIQELWLDESGPLGRQADSRALAGQILPSFDATRPSADVLYGYDLFLGDNEEVWGRKDRDGRRYVKQLEPFDGATHGRAADRSAGRQGQSAETRRNERAGRDGGGAARVVAAPVQGADSPPPDALPGTIAEYAPGNVTLDVDGARHRVQTTRESFRSFDGPLNGESLRPGRPVLVQLAGGRVLRVWPR